MWTADNRPRYNRDKLRYPSDLVGTMTGFIHAMNEADAQKDLE